MKKTERFKWLSYPLALVIFFVFVDRVLSVKAGVLESEFKLLRKTSEDLKIKIDKLSYIREERDKLKRHLNSCKISSMKMETIITFLENMAKAIPSSRKRNLVQIRHLKIHDEDSSGKFSFELKGVAVSQNSIVRFTKKLSRSKKILIQAYPTSVLRKVGKIDFLEFGMSGNFQ